MACSSSEEAPLKVALTYNLKGSLPDQGQDRARLWHGQQPPIRSEPGLPSRSSPELISESPPSPRLRRGFGEAAFARRRSAPAFAKATAGRPASEGWPPDRDAELDTEETIDAIAQALAERHEVVRIEADAEAYAKFRREAPEIVFNIAEGTSGAARESQIPAMLELLGIPYTGSDPLTLAVCLEKAWTKQVLWSYGIPTAPAFVVAPEQEEVCSVASEEPARGQRVSLAHVGLAKLLPAVVKPLGEGSSIGISNASLVRSLEELEDRVRQVFERYAQAALVEHFLPGREFTVALLGNGRRLETLPPVELRFDALPGEAHPIYSYEAKWVWDRPEKPLRIFECPARLSAELEGTLWEICLRTFRALGCRDWARVDVRCDEAGVPHILEVNPLPGILPRPEDNSCFPKAARAAGMSYSQLIHRVLEEALVRYGLVTAESFGR